MPRKKTNDEFLQELKVKNPLILPQETYKNAKTAIKCKCITCGKVWNAIPNNLLRGEGCPDCAGNQRISQDSFVARISKVNSNLIILGKYENAKTPVKYQCNNCGFINSSLPGSLLHGHGCPICGYKKMGQKRAKSNEQFQKEMHSINPDLKICSEYYRVDSLVKCQCMICGYEFEAKPDQLLHGKKCEKCQKIGSPLKKSNSTFLMELQSINSNIEPLEIYNGSSKKINVKCKICGFVWSTRPEQLLRGQGCPNCQKRWKTSFPEQAILFYLKDFYPDIINSYKEGFGKSELDIFIPSLKIGIEYDGRNWHKNKLDSEKEKYRICQELKIKLIRIRERPDNNSIKISDYIIHSIYGDTKKYKDLDTCIEELSVLLDIFPDIDTGRDQISIKEQYYKELKEKSLGNSFPKIAEEWYQPNNGSITPYMVRPKSQESFYWKCTKCGKIYPAVVSNRTAGHGCPKCANVERKSKDQFIEELNIYHPEIELIGEYQSLDKKIEFLCKECKTTNKSKARYLLNHGCPNCNLKQGELKKRLTEDEFRERVSALYSNTNIEVLGKYEKSNSRVKCRCKKCGEVWFPQANAVLSNNTGCSKCSNRKRKKVICVETSIVYNGINNASKATNISHGCISRCCNGKAYTAGGFHWKFAD